MAETRLFEATALYRSGKSVEALDVLQQVLIESPQDVAALQLAVEIHQALDQPCEAADLLLQIVEHSSSNPINVLVKAFDLHLRCGNHAAAESDLKRAILLDSMNPQLRRLLAQLLNAQGRRFEASEQVLELIRLRVIQPNELLSLVDLSGPFALVSYDGIVDSSQTSLFSLGEARYQYIGRHSEPDAVSGLVQRIVEKFPDSTAAAAFQGKVLADAGQSGPFQEWLSRLPAGIEKQPEYWYAIGHELAKASQHRQAIRALSEAIRLDPSDRGSMRTLANSLEQIGEETFAVQVRASLATLDEIFHTAREADAKRARWISDKMNELARPWESAAWWMYSAQLDGTLSRQIGELNRRATAIASWERGATLDQIRDANLKKLVGFDPQQFPLPDQKSLLAGSGVHGLSQRSTASLTPMERSPTSVRFEDVAQDAGLDTRLVSGFPTEGGAFYAYQVNGSGLAIFDYDLDGLSDVYVVQSGGLPHEPQGSTANQLFRLQSNQQFLDITTDSGAGDRGFGQGVCAGDVNQDGFVDLIVANIGTNVLLVNQGDGQFRDASDLLPSNPPQWTSCVGLADLDGDALPEIIEVNYIDDPQALEVRCVDDHLPCQPQRFTAAADHLLRCQPDGTFVPWTKEGQFDDKPKLGFGLVIANFDRKFGNDVFIANDGNMNHFWTSVAATPSSNKVFDVVESASARGCGIGRSGDSQACMGVASGDFNRDGTLDLHVTNFTGEPVNLFLQTSSGFFNDEAAKFGLKEPSFDVLGFGTQASDFDNDGWVDLAVVNGHVYDARRHQLAYKMRPQLFMGTPGAFSLVDPIQAGPYWQREHLGRCLAMWDWNRDGRMDLIANHLDDPIALLENRSNAQHWLQLELVGVDCEREAIGAEARVTAGTQTFTAWQTGGDGYMCSNEPILHVGLGDQQLVDKIEITWPSGRVTQFTHVQADARYLAIEGASTLELRFQSANNARSP